MTTITKYIIDGQVRQHMNSWMIAAESALRQFCQSKLLDEISKDKTISVLSIILSPAELAISTFAPPVGIAIALVNTGVTAAESVASIREMSNSQQILQQLNSELKASRQVLHDSILKIAHQNFAQYIRGEINLGIASSSEKSIKEMDRIYMEGLPLHWFKYESLRQTPTGSWEIDNGKTTRIILDTWRMEFYLKLHKKTRNRYVTTATGRRLFDSLLNSVIDAGIKIENQEGSMNSLVIRRDGGKEELEIVGRKKILNIKTSGYHRQRVLITWGDTVKPYRVYLIRFAKSTIYVNWEKNGIEFFFSYYKM